MAAGDYALGAFVLSDNVNYIVESASPAPAPLDLSRLPYAVREGSRTMQVRAAENPIVLHGLIRSTTFADTEAKLDAFVAAIYSASVQGLKLGYQDERSWKVRLSEFPPPEKQSGNLYAYEVSFLAVDPYAYAASASILAPGPVTFSVAPA